VTFNETLAALLELIGQCVSISAAGIHGVIGAAGKCATAC
jgi:hypothetical protein